MRFKLSFFRIFRACPPVHTFCKKFKVNKKERKHEIERQFLVHMSALSKHKIEIQRLIHMSTDTYNEIP